MARERLSGGDGSKRLSCNGCDVDANPPTLGLISLSPCSDGTLLAAVVHRDIETPIAYANLAGNLSARLR